MSKNSLTFQDLYKVIDDFRKENNERFDRVEKIFSDFHEKEFHPLERQVDKIWIYGSFAVTIISVGATMTWEWVKSKFRI